MARGADAGGIITSAACIAAALACAATAAQAADAVPQNLVACERIMDVAARAHCYDQAVAAMKAASAGPAPAAPVTTAPAPVVAVAPPPVQAQKFGQEQLPQAQRPRAAPEDEQLLSSISAIRAVGHKIWLITLANGQVWRQEGAQVTSFFTAGDQVHIEKGMLGDYRLSAERIGAKNWIRVVRVQ